MGRSRYEFQAVLIGMFLSPLLCFLGWMGLYSVVSPMVAYGSSYAILAAFFGGVVGLAGGILIAWAVDRSGRPDHVLALSPNAFYRTRAAEIGSPDVLATLLSDPADTVRAAVAGNHRSTPEQWLELSDDISETVLEAVVAGTRRALKSRTSADEDTLRAAAGRANRNLRRLRGEPEPLPRVLRSVYDGMSTHGPIYVDVWTEVSWEEWERHERAKKHERESWLREAEWKAMLDGSA